MATVIIRHKVGNFATWLKGHQDRVNVFSPLVSSFKTFQDANDQNSIAMVLEVTDLARMADMVNDPKLQHFKDKHTVIEPITISTEVEV
jgi:hypothetical protein